MSNVFINQDEYLAEVGHIFGAEYRWPALANDATAFIQIQATTKPISLVFGSSVEALTHVDSFYNSVLTAPTTLDEYNYKPSDLDVATAIALVSTAVTSLGSPQRGNNQIGSGSGGTGVGGSQSTRKTSLIPGEKITLRLTNKGGTNKSVSVGVYWSEF